MKGISLEVSLAHNTKVQRPKTHSATTAPLLMAKTDRSSYKYNDKIKKVLASSQPLLTKCILQITLACRGH